MKRTNVEINEELLKEAMELTKSKTQKEVLNLALEELIKSQRRLDMLNFRGKLKWEGNLDEMRSA